MSTGRSRKAKITIIMMKNTEGFTFDPDVDDDLPFWWAVIPSDTKEVRIWSMRLTFAILLQMNKVIEKVLT